MFKNGTRGIRLLPLAVAAIVLMTFGPDKLQHFHLWQRLTLVGGVAGAFVLSILLGRRSGTSKPDPVQNATLMQYAVVFWRVMAIANVCAALVGVIAVVVLHNAFPMRYLVLAPIVNLILAGLFYRAGRSMNRGQSKLA